MILPRAAKCLRPGLAGGVCQDEGYIPIGGLDKTLVVNDVLYLEVSSPMTKSGNFYIPWLLFPIAAAIGSWDMLLGDIRGLCGSRFPAYPRVLTNTLSSKSTHILRLGRIANIGQ